MKAFLCAFILAAAASIQVIAGNRLARAHLGIDLLLVCCVCCALLAREGAALAVAVCAGLFKDSFSAGIFGHSVAVFTPLALLLNRVRRAFWIAHWTTQAGLAFAATVIAWLLYGIFSRIYGEPADWGVGHILATAALNACVTPPVFKVWRAVLD